MGINAARSVLTARFPEWWPVILGGLFVAVVLFFPDGIVGIPNQCRRGIRRLRARLAGAPARRPQPAPRPSEQPASTVSRSDG